MPELQQRIAASEGVPVSRQRLIYQGKVLKPDQTLRSYNIEDGDALHLIVRAEDAPAAPPASSSAASAASSAPPASSPPPPAGFSFGPMTAFPGFPGGQMVMANLNVPSNGQMPDLNQLVSSVLNSIGALNAQQPQPQQQQQPPASLLPTVAASPTPSPPQLQSAPAAPQPATNSTALGSVPASASDTGSAASSAPFTASVTASSQPLSNAPQFMFASAPAPGGGPFAAGQAGAATGMPNGFPPPLRPIFATQGQPPFPQSPFPQPPFPQQLLAVGHPLTVNAAREALNAAAQASPSQSSSASAPAGRQSAAYEETMSGLLSLLSQSHALLSDAPRSVARVIDLLQAQNSASSSTTPAQRNVYQREAHQLGLFLRRLGHGLSGAGRLLSQVAPQNPNNSAPLALAPAPVVPLLGPVERPTMQQMAAGGGGDAQQQQWQQPQIHIQLQQAPMQPTALPAAGAASASASAPAATPPAAGSVPAAGAGNVMFPMHPMFGFHSSSSRLTGRTRPCVSSSSSSSLLLSAPC